MSSIEQLKDQFNGLEARERKMLMLGVVAVVIFLIYALIYKPMNNSISQLQKSNATNQTLLVWMTKSAAALKRTSGKVNKVDKRRGRNMNVVINTTASSANISISRSQPRDNKQYQIWIDEVLFNDLLLWLNILQNDYGVIVSNINLGTTGNIGQVKVNLTFQDSGS